MKIASHRLLRRGNIHTRRLAIELRLDGAENVFVPGTELRKLPDALGPIRKDVLDCPAWRRLIGAGNPVPVAAVVEVMSVILQRYSLWPIKFCSWREKADADGPQTPPGIQIEGRAVYEVGSERVGLAAGKAAVALTNAMIGDSSDAELHDLFHELLKDFVNGTNRESPSVDALQIARVATRRSIPWSVLHRSQYLRLGIGKHSQLLKGSESTHTASIHRAISRDKRLTHEILEHAGLPVAKQKTARSEEAALKHARTLGFPLVVKPLDGNMGRGVSIDLRDEDSVIQAFQRAKQISRRVILEQLIRGDEYRLLVVDGRLVAAIHRSPAQVCGDGSSTIEELVRKENSHPDRTPFKTDRTLFLRPILLDDEALGLLADHGVTPDSVPSEGEKILLRRESNLSRGGKPFDVTDKVHPSIRAVAERTAAVTGLDVCGVDFITTDLGKHYDTTGGAICEVNSRPGVIGHFYAMGSAADRIPGAILDMLFPKGKPAQMPVVALLGTPGQTKRLRRDIEAVATRANRKLGAILSSSRSTTLKSTLQLPDVDALNCDGDVEAAVIEITPKQLARNGIGFEHVDLAVLPPSDGADAHALAVQALTRIAGQNVAMIDDPGTLTRALKALNLPTDDVAFAAPATRPAVRRSTSSGKSHFTALFVGDVGFGESYMHRRRAANLEEILATHGPSYSFARLKGLLAMADLTVANLEVPLAETPDAALEGRKKYLGWCDSERTLAALKEAGIDAVTLANNHALDCGASGLAATMNHLHKAGIASFGAGHEAEAAARPFIQRFMIGGVERSLVVFGGFEHRSRDHNQYRWYASRRMAGIGKLTSAQIAPQIAALRDTLPNPTFVVFPHWGVDYAELTRRQKDMAAELADAGADLIVGHGAHILQGAEVVDGCMVLYNVGNFVWNTPGRFRKRSVPPYGLAVALTFGADLTEKPRLRLYPIVTDNALTGFQNRLTTTEEFVGAAGPLCDDLAPRFTRAQDSVGYHLEGPLPLRTPATKEPPLRLWPALVTTSASREAI